MAIWWSRGGVGGTSLNMWAGLTTQRASAKLTQNWKFGRGAEAENNTEHSVMHNRKNKSKNLWPTTTCITRTKAEKLQQKRGVLHLSYQLWSALLFFELFTMMITQIWDGPYSPFTVWRIWWWWEIFPNGFADYKAHVCPHQAWPQIPNVYTVKTFYNANWGFKWSHQSNLTM